MRQRTRALASVAVAFLLLAPDASADTPPEAWEVVLREQLLFEPSAVPVVLSWEDGLRARRFHLVAEAGRPFDLTLVRGRDNTFVFSGRRSSRYAVLVPWGRGEELHLSVHARYGGAIRVHLRLAVDPDEQGHAVYSLGVNEFLRLYEKGERDEAKASLARALAEDPADTMAAVLWKRSWQDEGLTAPPREIDDDESESRYWRRIAEGQRQRSLAREAGGVLEEAGADSALALLDRAAGFETPVARRDHHLLRGRLALMNDRPSLAMGYLYTALDACETVEERFLVYPWLVRANLAIGNEPQAEALVEHAFSEATTDDQRESARSWLER